MIIVPLKEGENIERALKKFKRKFEKTGIVKELRKRQALQNPLSRRESKKFTLYTYKSFSRRKNNFFGLKLMKGLKKAEISFISFIFILFLTIFVALIGSISC